MQPNEKSYHEGGLPFVFLGSLKSKFNICLWLGLYQSLLKKVKIVPPE